MEALDGAHAGWGVASLPLPGETESGDSYVVKPHGTHVLIAVIDALGHGHEAAQAARVATAALSAYANEAVDFLLRQCNALMRETRGAAISLGLLDTRQSTLTWLGVGNVTGALVRADPKLHPRVKRMMVRSGVVGSQLPDLQPSVIQIAPGDTLILATDGVSSDFTETLPDVLDPQPLADRILQGYATNNDDALVLIFPFGAALDKSDSSDGQG